MPDGRIIAGGTPFPPLPAISRGSCGARRRARCTRVSSKGCRDNCTRNTLLCKTNCFAFLVGWLLAAHGFADAARLYPARADGNAEDSVPRTLLAPLCFRELSAQRGNLEKICYTAQPYRKTTSRSQYAFTLSPQPLLGRFDENDTTSQRSFASLPQTAAPVTEPLATQLCVKTRAQLPCAAEGTTEYCRK